MEQREGHWHWVAAGPAGVPISWDAEVIAVEPNELLCWSSLEGSRINTPGRVQLKGYGSGTLIEIRLSYAPPAGPLGHAVARLLGADPKTALDEDMVRLKGLLETGKTTVRGRQVRTDQLGS